MKTKKVYGAKAKTGAIEFVPIKPLDSQTKAMLDYLVTPPIANLLGPTDLAAVDELQAAYAKAFPNFTPVWNNETGSPLVGHFFAAPATHTVTTLPFAFYPHPPRTDLEFCQCPVPAAGCTGCRRCGRALNPHSGGWTCSVAE